MVNVPKNVVDNLNLNAEMINYLLNTTITKIDDRSQMKKWKSLVFKIALLVVIAIVISTA